MQTTNKYIQRISFSKILSPGRGARPARNPEKLLQDVFCSSSNCRKTGRNKGSKRRSSRFFPSPISRKLRSWISFPNSRGLDVQVRRAAGGRELDAGLHRLRRRCWHWTRPAGKNSVCPECHEKGTVIYKTCELCGDLVRLKIQQYPRGVPGQRIRLFHPLKVKLRLALYAENKKGEKVIRDVKEQEIFFGEIPFMTDKGTFIINGTERVMVSQLQRSPGVYFMPGKSRGEYTAKIIPARGAWIELEEKLNLLQVRLDKKTKRINITTFLKAMGLADDARDPEAVLYHRPGQGRERDFLFPEFAVSEGQQTDGSGVRREGQGGTSRRDQADDQAYQGPGKNRRRIRSGWTSNFSRTCIAADDLDNVLKLNEPVGTAQIKKLRKLNMRISGFLSRKRRGRNGARCWPIPFARTRRKRRPKSPTRRPSGAKASWKKGDQEPGGCLHRGVQEAASRRTGHSGGLPKVL